MARGTLIRARGIRFDADQVREILAGRLAVRVAVRGLKPGRRVWIKEAMRVDRAQETLVYDVDGVRIPRGCFAWESWMYEFGKDPIHPRHMPRWASRLTLEVVSVGGGDPAEVEFRRLDP